MELQNIELTIEDETKQGVFAISLVGKPAIKEEFIALSENTIELKVVDQDKRIVMGYALVPDKKIYRRMNDKEFNVHFKAHTIEKTNELFMKSLNLNNITSEHEHEVSGVSVIESWITEDAKLDKIALYGIEPIVGGWAVKMKIDNEEEWGKVKNGEYSGFSIEGLYSGLDKVLAKEEKTLEEVLIEQLEQIINSK